MASEQYFCGTCGGPGEHVVLGTGECESCLRVRREDRRRSREEGRPQRFVLRAKMDGSGDDHWVDMEPDPAEVKPRGIMQYWTMELGLRHQGVLLTAVRGCDTAPKDDPSKLLTRCIRAVLLNAHCDDPRKAATFIQVVSDADLYQRFEAFRRNLDHYPHHYIAHVMHALEIIGYKHPDPKTRNAWHSFYLRMVRGLHLNPETEAELDERLNADEKTFSARDFEPVALINRQENPGGGGGA